MTVTNSSATTAPAERAGRRPQRKTRGKPTAVDIYVGQRLRERRLMLDMSQEKLAAALDVTFQQVQKYERGTNRLGAGRLLQVANALGVSVVYFFEGCDESGGAPVVTTATRGPSREALSAVAHLDAMPPALRRRFVDLIAAAAGEFRAGSIG